MATCEHTSGGDWRLVTGDWRLARVWASAYPNLKSICGPDLASYPQQFATYDTHMIYLGTTGCGDRRYQSPNITMNEATKFNLIYL